MTHRERKCLQKYLDISKDAGMPTLRFTARDILQDTRLDQRKASLAVTTLEAQQIHLVVGGRCERAEYKINCPAGDSVGDVGMWACGRVRRLVK